MLKNLFVLSLIVFMSGLNIVQPQVAEAEHPVKVEVFVTSWCTFCRALEKFLQEEDIPYTRYDIEKDTRAKRLYRSMNLRGIPITRVGSEIISGYNPWSVRQAIDRAKRGSPLQGS